MSEQPPKPLTTPGDRVRHHRFGPGRVTAVSPGTNGDILTVWFDGESTPREIASAADALSVLSAWDEGRISPPWAEIDDPQRFVPPLTPAERDLAQLLDASLDPAWRIYVRPHLDADRPVIAAMHPNLGGMIWDVVPWDLEGARVVDGIWHVRIGRAAGEFVSPIRYLDQIRRKLYGTYLPGVGEAIDEGTARFSLVRAGLYFPFATASQVSRLITSDQRSEHVAVLSRDRLSSEGLDSAFGGRFEPAMQAGWFDEFDRVLGHAHQQVSALAAITLTRELERLAVPTPGAQVIEGVAGSGKSVVLAYRAARIAASGGRVLVLTYNRTLTNYLRAQIARVPVRWLKDRISVMHFHELAKRIHAHHLQPPPLSGDDETDGELSHSLDHLWPASAIHVLERFGIPESLRFDAVLVDEGQDFSEEYANVVTRLLPGSDGQVVIAHDPAQRIYGRPSVLSAAGHPWTKIRPRRLRQGIRLSQRAASAATAFAQRWSLPTDAIEAHEEGLLPEAPGPFLVTVTDESEAAAAALALLMRWRDEPRHSPGDVTVLVPSREFGTALVRLLAEHGVSTNHVFPVRRTGAEIEEQVSDGPDWLVERSQKDSFAVGDVRLKVSTIHSFKGWDSRRVILIVPPERRNVDARTLAAVYVGITRANGEAVYVLESPAYGIESLGLEALAVDAQPAVQRRFTTLVRDVARSRSRPRSGRAPPLAPPSGSETA